MEKTFLLSLMIWLISTLLLSPSSNKGCPVKVDWMPSLSKYFFSKGNNNKIWSKNDLSCLTLCSLQTQTCGATKWIVFIAGFLFLTSFATRNVKSGLSTEKSISGLNLRISFTVSFIFFLF